MRRGRQKSEHTDSSVHQCRNAPYFCPTLTQKCGSILCLPTEVGRKHTQRQAHVERHLYLLGQKYSWGMLHTYTKHAFVCVCACVCMCVCACVCISQTGVRYTLTSSMYFDVSHIGVRFTFTSSMYMLCVSQIVRIASIRWEGNCLLEHKRLFTLSLALNHYANKQEHLFTPLKGCCTSTSL